MGGSTFKCNLCNFTVRVSSGAELDEYQQEHNKTCNGILESIWKNYDKMSKEEKDEKMKKLMFRHGVINV